MGLGCGGPSRLGLSDGKSKSESAQVVHAAFDMGINFFDTAESYGTEEIVGSALKGISRDQVVISTKKGLWDDKRMVAPKDLPLALENSLTRLGTDYVDIYHLHAVRPSEYEFVRNEIVPVLLKLKDQGKVCRLGVTEFFGEDTSHRMLQKALSDDFWDVVMVGFNILNPSARYSVFPRTIEKNIGVLIMFAVRRALSRPARLLEVVDTLKQRGKIRADLLSKGESPLGFLIGKDGAESVVDAAYRFCRHEPGVHVVLSGTGNVEHLHSNFVSLEAPDLPPEMRRRLEMIFRDVDDVSGS